MKTREKLSLEETMEKWLDTYCENFDPPMFIHPELSKQMTNAAELVFDACVQNQKYYIKENSQ